MTPAWATLSGFALVSFGFFFVATRGDAADSRSSPSTRSASPSHAAPRSSARGSSRSDSSRRSGSSHHDGGRWGGRSRSWGWGWGWGYRPWWGYPYGYYGYYGYPGYGGYAYGDGRSRFAAVKTDVEPDEAALYLDGKLIGTADDFDGYPDMLYLGPGRYRLEFRLEGYEPYTTEVDASSGGLVKIDRELRKIPGAKHYGTYTPAEPAGPIVRYFEKRRRSSDTQRESTWRDRSDRPRGADSEDSTEAYMDDEAGPAGDSADADVAPDREEDLSIDEHTGTSRPAPPEAPPAISGSSEARIVFDVSPPDAAVYVDDHFAGSARELNGLPGGLAVPVGEHRVTVTCPGYREATIRIQSSEAQKERARIDLKR